jgi:molecular chaperone DnaK
MNPVVVVVLIIVVVVVLAYLLGVYLRRRNDAVSLARLASPGDRATAALDRETRAVVGWLLSQAFEQTGVHIADDKLAYDRILTAAKKAVQELKTQDAAIISLPFLTADASGPKHLDCRLTREAIQELVRS